MTKPLELTINIDGAARGNPGPAAFACVIAHEGEVLLEEKGYLGTATNNVAEYTALIKAFEKAAELKATSVLIRSDSELLVKQMHGQYRVRNEQLLPLYQQAKQLSEQFESVRISHVFREQNREADRLCNEALDEASRSSGRSAHPATETQSMTRRPSVRPGGPTRGRTWQATLTEAENLFQEAARRWATGSKEPSPREVLDRLLTLLQERGFLAGIK